MQKKKNNTNWVDRHHHHINELNQLIGDDEITEEEYQDMVSYIQNKNRNNLNKK